MRSRKEFFEYVKDNIHIVLPEEYKDADIRLQEVTKNNDQVLTGLIIQKEGEIVVPNIYLDSFYEEYLHGADPNRLLEDIKDARMAHQADIGNPEVIVDLARDYEAVKERLIVRICDSETNQERLAKMAHTVHGDFAATYHIDLFKSGDATATIPITHDMVKGWGITVEQLHVDALVVASSREAQLFDLGSLLESQMFGMEPQNLLKGAEPEQSFLPTPMFCLTNEAKVDGAALVLQSDVLARIGEVIGENYYVLPSSVHETLIIPDNGSITLPELSAMVHEVNENEVSAEDRLSDKVQYFDRDTGVLENAQKREMRLEKAKEKRTVGKKKGIHAKLEASKEKAKKQEKKEPAKHKDRNIDL